MIGFFAKLLLSRNPAMTVAHARRLVIIALVVVGLVVLGIAGCVAKGRYDRGVVDRARLEGNNAALEDAAEADAGAASGRVSDAVRAAAEIDQLEESLKDAPSDPVAARREFYRCVRLQQQARAAGQPAPACP